MDLALNNLQRLICYKIRTTNEPISFVDSLYITPSVVFTLLPTFSFILSLSLSLSLYLSIYLPLSLKINR